MTAIDATGEALAQEFLTRARHFLTFEYRTKLHRAVEALPADRLWWRAHEQANSVGNLLAHLAGNVRQWIVSGVGGATDVRHRSLEFSRRDDAGKAELLATLDRAVDEADAVIGRLTPAQLLEMRTIQGRTLTVLDAVFHVVEHFALHLGQIILIAKEHAPGAIRFYEDAGDLAKPIWRDGAPAPPHDRRA